MEHLPHKWSCWRRGEMGPGLIFGNDAERQISVRKQRGIGDEPLPLTDERVFRAIARQNSKIATASAIHGKRGVCPANITAFRGGQPVNRIPICVDAQTSKRMNP
ncbi:MAG: hypothetical protein ABSE22_05615 [Xanthobacteraceae bacterium]